MEFFRELAEARMTRTSSLTEKLTYKDVCENAYLCLLILELLRQYPRFAKKAQEYAKDTAKYSGFDNFRMTATDLYNFLYFVTGDKDALQRLKNPQQAQESRNKTSLPELAVMRYLRKVGSGSTPEQVHQLFIRLEKVLDIKNPNIRKVRRTVTNLATTSKIDRESAVKQLLQIARKQIKTSDLIRHVEDLAQAKDPVSTTVPDEDTLATKPDLPLRNSDVIYLQRLVGTKNLFLAIKYIELAAQGKTIPANLVQAFNPAVEVLVDIIKGGPTFLAGLRRIQKSAKQARRRQ